MLATHMVTNGGPHPADKWAETTSSAIVDTLLVDANQDDASDAAIAARAEKRKLRAELFEIFNSHHDGVQRHERGEAAKAKKPDAAAARVIAPIDPTPHLGVMTEVNQAFARTKFAEHLAKPEVQEIVRSIIGNHTVDVMHIERRWHHDRMTQGA